MHTHTQVRDRSRHTSPLRRDGQYGSPGGVNGGAGGVNGPYGSPLVESYVTPRTPAVSSGVSDWSGGVGRDSTSLPPPTALPPPSHLPPPYGGGGGGGYGSYGGGGSGGYGAGGTPPDNPYAML